MGYYEGDDHRGDCDVCGEEFNQRSANPSVNEIGEFYDPTPTMRVCECGATAPTSPMFMLHHHGNCSRQNITIVPRERPNDLSDHYICHAQCGIDAELEMA